MAAEKKMVNGSLYFHQWDSGGIILNKDILHYAAGTYSLQLWDPSDKNIYECVEEKRETNACYQSITLTRRI